MMRETKRLELYGSSLLVYRVVIIYAHGSSSTLMSRRLSIDLYASAAFPIGKDDVNTFYWVGFTFLDKCVDVYSLEW